MYLTLHTDYALRVLLYLAHFPERRVGTQEISNAFCISKHHLVRVVHTLAEHGFVTANMGRGGGVALAMPPETIRVGRVVRACEPNFRMVECFDKESNTCPIISVCGLKAPLHEALQAFLESLDKYTLAEIAKSASRAHFIQLLHPKEAVSVTESGHMA